MNDLNGSGFLLFLNALSGLKIRDIPDGNESLSDAITFL